MIINKLYKIQFSHHPKTDSESVLEQQSWNTELKDSENFAELTHKTKLPEKCELLDKRGFELMEKEEQIPAPRPTLIQKLSMMSME